MSNPMGYKPSPLGNGNVRSSPFRRAESPASPSTLRQQQTPTASPFRARNGSAEPRVTGSGNTTPTADTWTMRTNTNEVRSPASPQAPRFASQDPLGASALSQLQSGQIRTLRDGFSLLDRDSDGVVTREDVAEMLKQLGLPSSQADVSKFFPPSAPQTMPMAVFMNTIATSLAALSPASELEAAFAAFDEDDSGQIDLGELRDALLNTAPEPGERALTAAEVDMVLNGFTGRRTFSRSRTTGTGKKGEIFKYHDFVNSISGGNGTPQQASPEDSEDA